MPWARGPQVGFVDQLPQRSKVAISSSSLLTLAASPVMLTPAPASNEMLLLRYAVLSYLPGSTGFTVQGDEDLMIEYSGGTDASLAILADNNTGGIDFTGTTAKQIVVPSAFPADTMATMTAVLGQGFRLDQVGAGEWDNGDGHLTVILVYDKITVI